MSDSITSSLPAKPPASHAGAADDSHFKSAQAASKSINGESSKETDDLNHDQSDSTNSSQSAPEQPPLPLEEPPPLSNEQVPGQSEDDGWEPVWDEKAQAFYFFNKFTKVTQWENPRIPPTTIASSTRVEDTGPPGALSHQPIKKPVAGGYDPAIHGDYDPNADYARVYDSQDQEDQSNSAISADPALAYAATGAFNRFTGKWQSAEINPDKFSDENKSKRQMNAFFDVDAAANAHDGRSLKAERSSKKITKQELKAYREKRKEKKEEKRRAWLRD